MLAKAPRKRTSGPLHDAVDEGGADFPLALRDLVSALENA